MENNRRGFSADGRWLAWGLVLGVGLGVVVALLGAPKSGPDFRECVIERAQSVTTNAKARLKSAAPTDTVAQSMAEGKEAARRRREGAAP